MGTIETNCWIGAHYCASEGTTYRPRIHYGNGNIDTTAPAITKADMGSLRNATGTQSAFDDAVDDIGAPFATWYSGLDSTSQSQLRDAIRDDAS